MIAELLTELDYTLYSHNSVIGLQPQAWTITKYTLSHNDSDCESSSLEMD